MAAEASTDDSAVPPKTDNKPESSAGSSARKEKRAQWWAGNMEKRLSGQDGTAQASEVSWNESKASPMLPRKRKAAAPRDDEDQTKGAMKPGVSSDGNRTKGNTPFTIFIGQIPYEAKEEEVRKLFETVGKIKTFRWRINPETKKFKGFAFVDYEDKHGFKRSFQLHHSIVCGRPINVEATITGGRKSRHRAVHIKDRTAKLQHEANEALERKARDAAKKKANKAATIAAGSAATDEKPGESQGEFPAEALPADTKKRERTAKIARANKRLKAAATSEPSLSEPTASVKAEPSTPKPTLVARVMVRTQEVRPDNFVKPRQEHLAVLSNTKKHIKFED